MWIWAGIDVTTRLPIAFHVGDMSSEPAKTLIVAIKVRGVPGLIRTDGLDA